MLRGRISSRALVFVALLTQARAFLALGGNSNQEISSCYLTIRYPSLHASDKTAAEDVSISNVEEASRILETWDKYYNQESGSATSLPDDVATLRGVLPEAVRLLNKAAQEERDSDSTIGRCMLGICAPSTADGVAALKSWVTSLQLPRGLLHGMDKEGVPLEIKGGVYIKYNTGGILTFEQMRKSGMGFDALWKPGDALLEPYDGSFRGVYFQVELSDEIFRQYLLPLDTFDTNT